MNSIMIVLLALLAVSLASVAFVALRNRIIFLMGLRNIPRRLAQTVLIIVGLMLSTLIISAAFATGDTVDYSISNQAYSQLGHIDLVVEPGTGAGNEGFDAVFETGGVSARDIKGDDYEAFQAAFDGTQIENVDGWTPILFEEVPVINQRTRLSEPLVTFVGLEPARLQAFPDVTSAETGETLDVGALSDDEVFANKSAADQLDVVPGDVVQVYVNNEPHEFTVVSIIEDRVLTGTRDASIRQGLVTRMDTLHGIFGHNDVDLIAISLDGGIRGTLDLTDGVESEVKALLKRNDLPLDMGNSKKDAVALAEDFSNFMTTFFLLLGLFSIGAGMLLIVMIFVMLAAERKSEMGMARAVGTKRGHLVQMFMAEGMAYNVLAAAVGAGLGIIVAFGMALLLAVIFSGFGISVEPYVTLRTVAISYSLGVVLTFVTVTFASWRVSNLNIVRAIRDIPEPAGRRMGWRGLLTWTVLIALGVLSFVTGLTSDLAFPFALGFSLVAAGLAVLLTHFTLPARPVYTTAGILLLVLWVLTAGQRLEWLFGKLEGDIEMFFLSGVAMVTASTFVLIYNSDIVLAFLTRVGGLFGPILPAMKTAVAYPLNNRFRTGMTLAMISLVVFALTMMSAMNLNFGKVFLADESRGGWDILVEENPNNAVSDLPAALREGGSDAADSFLAVGRLSRAGGFSATEVKEPDDDEYSAYAVKGTDGAFIENGSIPLEARAAGYESDEAVWRALQTRDDVAVIDDFAVESGFGDEGFELDSIQGYETTFQPAPVIMRDPVSGNTREVRIIGVIAFGSSSSFNGLFVSDTTFQEVFGEPEFSWHYVALRDSGESKDVAQKIESTLLTAGVQAESLKEIADREQAFSRNFFYLMQAFMGLGLFVGIAAVGVIAFRTVVERRQQIGMLRAIGYKRSMVALSFMMESSFVTLLALGSGMTLGLWLSYFLVTSDDFQGDGQSYFVPWREITFIALFTFIASLVMTYIPSRQAATIPVAEALRYE